MSELERLNKADWGKVEDSISLTSPQRDPDDIEVEERLATHFPRVGHEIVEQRKKVTWVVGGKDVLIDLGDGTYEVVRWPHASIEDLERLFYAIGELLTITNPTESPKG